MTTPKKLPLGKNDKAKHLLIVLPAIGTARSGGSKPAATRGGTPKAPPASKSSSPTRRKVG